MSILPFFLFKRALWDSVQPICSSRGRPCSAGDLDNSNTTSTGKREEVQGEDDKRVLAYGEEESWKNTLPQSTLAEI